MPERKDNTDNTSKEVLDLLGGKPKKVRAADKAAADKVATLKKAVEPAIEPKMEALDLLSAPKRKPGVKKVVSPAPVIPQETPSGPVKSSKKEGKKAAAPVLDIASPVAPALGGGVLNIKSAMTVADLAVAVNLKSFQLIKNLMDMNIFANTTTAIDPETIVALCEMHNISCEREKREKGAGVRKVVEKIEEPPAMPVEEAETRAKRFPIVTIMGHVDHGKTSLLDYIRRAKVTATEAGGITQHIAAYTVKHAGETITFLDTPGHAIFSEMRARGADVTDIVVIVVAANDGIMPQTREAISHAKAAKKTIIIAINKCDLDSADILRAKTGLMEEGLVPTDFGGETECVEISALTGAGVGDLLDLIALHAEVLELQADPKANSRAAIIEASVQPGKGISATVIVEAGTLKVGKSFICGCYSGKIRTLTSDQGVSLKRAIPGMPVEVVGFEEIPNVGDEMVQMDNERAAKKLAEERQLTHRQERLSAPKKSRMEDIMSLMKEGGQKSQLKLILKGDVQGSVEAIRNAISDIKSDKVETNFLTAAAGPITESDIILASSSDSIILGFNTKVESKAVPVAKREGVQIKLYSIVYELIDQVREAMLGLLTPETRETVIGHAEVRQVFKLNKGRAAGSYVKDGKILRTAGARVIRDRQPVFDGKMSTLRRFQDEVNEVKAGLECGIRLGDFNEYEEGDIIECYILEKIKQTL